MLGRTLYPVFRRVDFRGKGRLRRVLPVPSHGVVEAGFPGGMRLRLDLRESLQRDFLFGLYDLRELRLVREWLRGGGDFVDVGAHVGMYAVAAALALRGRGRVLAFEPNPAARAQLEENLALNGCDNVVVSAAAVSDRVGETLLHVPATPDPSFSSLEGGRFAEGEPVAVQTTTVDREVARHGMRPAVVKIDVEGRELRVLAGMEGTLAHRPAVIVEVDGASGAELDRRLGDRGYRAYRVGPRGLEPGLTGASGLFNAAFVPR
ncbi:MAG: FkbM family methyltransferase [Actinomycetota bacterium]|nr:FkbM family methyltransferase [Actinomycetota bacterium]